MVDDALVLFESSRLMHFSIRQCPVRSLENVTSGLVLCCLAVEYVSLSKRFLPELVSFLLGTLHLAVEDKSSLGTSRRSLPLLRWPIPALTV